MAFSERGAGETALWPAKSGFPRIFLFFVPLLRRHLLRPLQMLGVDVGGALLVGQGGGTGHDALALLSYLFDMSIFQLSSLLPLHSYA